MAIPEEFRGRVLAYCQEPEPEEADLLVLDQAWDSAESYLKGAGAVSYTHLTLPTKLEV